MFIKDGSYKKGITRSTNFTRFQYGTMHCPQLNKSILLLPIDRHDGQWGIQNHKDYISKLCILESTVINVRLYKFPINSASSFMKNYAMSRHAILNSLPKSAYTVTAQFPKKSHKGLNCINQEKKIHFLSHFLFPPSNLFSQQEICIKASAISLNWSKLV